MPVLAIQGRLDTVSRPAQTRTLLDRLPAPPSLLEVDAGHDLVTEASPVRDEVLAAVLAFASGAATSGVAEPTREAPRT
jgi:pimeloyl-ACP methyl ester carboxylesterase